MSSTVDMALTIRRSLKTNTWNSARVEEKI